MPGLLKPSAVCPECGTLLIGTCRTANSERTVFEYIHDPDLTQIDCKVIVNEPHVKSYERWVYDALHVGRKAS